MKTRAPGKIILSGEHAILHGAPLLATSVNCYTETEIKKSNSNQNISITIHIAALDISYTILPNHLFELKKQIDMTFEKYKAGKALLQHVIPHPRDFVLYIIATFLKTYKTELGEAITVFIQSSIPIKSGMGSSSAILLSLLLALSHYFSISVNTIEQLELAKKMEHLLHSESSGIDLLISQKGGYHFVHNNFFKKRELLPSLPLYLVNTGIPTSNTGECVEHTKYFFKKKATPLIEEFTAITFAMDEAIMYNNKDNLKMAIKQNHLLLKKIGVVPKKIGEFIQHLESYDAAAKICGAGSIRGENGGMILVYSENDISEYCTQWGYPILTLQGEKHGLQIV